MAVSPDKVRSQLKRLLGSYGFARSERMARLLEFIVHHSIEGNFDSLKERQIGIEIFDRPEDWDPKLDNIVRSEARRLRSKLDSYAALASPDEEVRITVPKGGYRAEFVELVPATANSQPPASQPAGPPPTVRLAQGRLLTGIAAAILIAIGLALASNRQGQVEAKADQFTIVPFANELGEQFSPAASPDGKRVAYVWDGNGRNYDIFIKDVAAGTTSRITDDALPDLHPAWSPDGRELAFLRSSDTGHDLIVKRLSGGSERVLTRTKDTMGTWASENPFAGCQGLSWSPDGEEILATDSGRSGWGSGLVSVAVSSGSRKPVTTPYGQDCDCFPRFSPDGRTIAFVRYLSHGVGEIFTVSKDGSGLHRLTTIRQDVRGLDWTADGRGLVFASNSNGAYRLRTIDLATRKEQPLPAETSSVSEPSVARAGGWLAFVDNEENWNIWRVKVENGRLGEPRRFLSSLGRNHSPSFSPDGRTIAFVSDRDGSPEIWFADGDGANLRKRTHFNGPWLGTIRWRPDGKEVLFDARPNGHSALFTMRADGGSPTQLLRENFEARRPNWSRDGKSIYFDLSRDGRPQLWKRDMRTGQNRLLTQTETLFASESADGSGLFYQDGEQQIWRSGPNGEQPGRLPLELRPRPNLDWFVTKKQIYFAAGAGSASAIYSYSLNDGAVKKLGDPAGALAIGTPSLVVSPDGQWMLYAVKEHTRSEIKLRKGT